METELDDQVRISRVRTDPTYKEWKLNNSIFDRGVINRTDPTYKEWKPRQKDLRMLRERARILPTRNGNKFADILKDVFERCTDPTYKEWKLNNIGLAILDWTSARILPTRNGNIF